MKIPLSYSLKNRDATTNKDARVLNGYVEIKGDPKKGGSVRTLKRPALDSAYSLTAGTGQALYVPSDPTGSGEPGVVIGDLLTRAPSPLTKRLRFTVQPSNVALNTAISPAVQVTAYNSIGGVASGFGGTVALVIGTNPTGATLGGTVSQLAVSGVATFNNLTLNRSGADFTLAAASTGLRGVVSSAFDIATALAFTLQPTTADINATFTCEVTAQDSLGATDTNYTGNVTVSIYSASAGGTLSGTLTVPAIAGIATFSNLQIDVAGTYALQATAEASATAYTPSRATSNTFQIGPYILTSAFDGVDAFGFSLSPPLGSIAPSTYQGATIHSLFGQPAIGTAFVLTGNRLQTFFTTLTVDGVSVASSSAYLFNYNGGLNLTTWLFTPQLITSVGAKNVEIIP